MTSTSSQIDLPAEEAERSTGSNVARLLVEMATRLPDQPALIITRSRDNAGRAVYRRITFAQLEELSNRYANGLATAGIARGMRVLLMVPAGLEFVSLTFALFKIGSVPVLIDPGMGVGRLLECVRDVEPQALVGIPKAHALRVLKRRYFSSVRRAVTVGRRWFWRAPTLRGLCRNASSKFTVADSRADETAAILFTSGSTGPAKGVVYEHGIFDAQVRMIRDEYGIRTGEVDLASFPLFSLFSVAMGMTCVIPDMDPSRPADADPAKIVEAMVDNSATGAFGSPALWDVVSGYCVERGLRLPTLRRILIAGAPVSHTILERLFLVLGPEADVYTPYGATESLPVASMSGREILADCSDLSRRGAGTCVGRVFDGMEVRLIRITDEPIAEWSADLQVAQGEKGEIVVSGPVVTRKYYGKPRATALAKIIDGDRVWHRIGDVGYRDERGRIWFCGRKAHRVVTDHGTLFSVPCEAIFNEHGRVNRSALVGVGPAGRQEPVIVIEPHPEAFPKTTALAGAFREQLLELARECELTGSIRNILFHSSLPVDVRHNAKINREALSVWAAEQLR